MHADGQAAFCVESATHAVHYKYTMVLGWHTQKKHTQGNARANARKKKRVCVNEREREKKRNG